MNDAEDAAAARPQQVKATREDWLNTARDTLISDGVEKVKVLSLAKKLDVSRSSFYWYFKDRRDLLDQLLAEWRATNSRAILERAARPAPDVAGAVLNVFECWTDERLFDPLLDFAIREWARRSGSVRRALDREDDARVAAIEAMFRRHGFDEDAAYVRARTLYYMQIGYYALELREPLEARLQRVPDYVEAFTGQRPTPGEMAGFLDWVAQR